MNPKHKYFAELFDGSKTDPAAFSCNMEAVNHFIKKYGMNLLAVKRYDEVPKLVYCA